MEDNSNDESSVASVNADDEYDYLIEMLRDSTKPVPIEFDSVGLFRVVLNRVEEFCHELAASEGVSRVTLDIEAYQITQENPAAWNVLLEALKNLCENTAVEAFDIHCSLLRCASLIQVLRDLPQSTTLSVDVISFSQEENEINEQLEIFESSGHQLRENVCLHLEGDFELDIITVATLSRALSNAGRFSELFVANSKLSHEACALLAEELSSNTCTVEKLSLYSCKLHEIGGQQLARAFSSNQSLKNLSLSGSSLEEASIRNELLSSLPSNKSIETLSFDLDASWFRVSDDTFFKNLFRNVVCANHTIKYLNICDILSGLADLIAPQEEAAGRGEPEDLSFVLCDLSQNYTLEKVSGVGPNSPHQAILRLNRAGRSYLRDDPASASESVDVLAKVKDDLDCLFVHIRENPVPLCSPKYLAGNGGGNDGNKKRKADEITTDA